MKYISLCQALGQWRRAKKWVSNEKAGELPRVFRASLFSRSAFPAILEPGTG